MKPLFSLLALLSLQMGYGQHISSFTSVVPGTQSENFVLPSKHKFHFILKEGDTLTDGNLLPTNNDFTGYIPINGSSRHGYLCINSESVPGGVTIAEITFDTTTAKWRIDSSYKVNFATVNGTRNNCSGGVSPWGTLVTCEETTSSDLNADGFNDYGWAIEINPATHTVINHPGGLLNGDKLWALGNFPHENITFHSNRRTIYQGVDAATGYLFKFVADTAEKLYAGKLYAYRGSKNGNGRWVKINNSTSSERNNVLQRCGDSLCTTFSGIEDVEYNSLDGRVYLAVKNENCVYSFSDDNALNGDSIHNFITFVGNTSYTINYSGGSTSVPWGTGNDNLAFDDLGNLWVFQDGSNNHIWLAENGHTQIFPKVKLFAKTPAGSEPTGITFTPDNKYMFMSIQHPNSSNSTTQPDAFGNNVLFDKAVSLVVARDSSFIPLPIVFAGLWVKKSGNGAVLNWQTGCELFSYGFFVERSIDGNDWQDIGMVLSENNGCKLTNYTFYDESVSGTSIYYRLRQTDVDGKEYISEVVRLDLFNSMPSPSHCFPNPAKPGATVTCGSEQPIHLLDALGQTLPLSVAKINENWRLTLPANKGIYILLFNNGHSERLICVE